MTMSVSALITLLIVPLLSTTMVMLPTERGYEFRPSVRVCPSVSVNMFSRGLVLSFLAALWLLPCDTITPSYCPSYWNPLQSSCPLAEDVLEKLAFALEHELAGQVLARRTIEKAIARNVNM